MHDWTQRGTHVPTYWKQTAAAPNPAHWELWGVNLGPVGEDVLLGAGPDHAACLPEAQRKLKEHYPGRFI